MLCESDVKQSEDQHLRHDQTGDSPRGGWEEKVSCSSCKLTPHFRVCLYEKQGDSGAPSIPFQLIKKSNLDGLLNENHRSAHEAILCVHAHARAPELQNGGKRA